MRVESQAASGRTPESHRGDVPELRTDRLLLRGWEAADREGFADLNSDPRVMEFLGKPWTRKRSDAFADSVEARLARDGFGFWAVEARGVAPFIGMVGLNRPSFDAPFMPAIEVGWRLAHDFWGQGYATEAACGALDFAFHTLGAEEIVAFTTRGNLRSMRVMERLGMSHDPTDDFDHPLVAPGSPFRAHVLHRICRDAAEQTACAKHEPGAS